MTNFHLQAYRSLKQLLCAKKHKIQAFSIAESISALLIVTISFGAGISIYGQISRDDIGNDNLQVGAILDSLMNETKKKKTFVDDSFIVDEMKIVKKVETYNNQSNLLKVCFTALTTTDNMEIYKISEVIYP